MWLLVFPVLVCGACASPTRPGHYTHTTFGDLFLHTANFRLLGHRRSDLVQALEATQAESQALGAASYPDEARDGSVLPILLDAQVGQSILAWIEVSTPFGNVRVGGRDLPNTLRAYRLALRN